MLIIIELLIARATILFVYSQVICLWWQIVVSFVCCLFCDAVPHSFDSLLVVHSLKDAITSNEEEIKVWLQFETLNLRLAYNYIHVSTIFRTFCFDITESSGYWKTAREYSQWSLNIQVFLVWGSGSLSKRLRPINLATCGLDSNALLLIVGLVISRAYCNLGASIEWHDTPTIAHIYNISHVVNNHYHCGTWSRSLWSHLLTWHRMLCSCLCNFN